MAHSDSDSAHVPKTMITFPTGTHHCVCDNLELVLDKTNIFLGTPFPEQCVVVIVLQWRTDQPCTSGGSRGGSRGAKEPPLR